MTILNTKHIHLAAFASLALSAGAAHAAPYGMAGCGLGSMMITSNGGSQVFAATTNGTSGSQTFGISSGTSNCVRQGVVLTSKEQEAFFEANLLSLQQDMVAGEGEHLNALLSLFACRPEAQAAAGKIAQAQFEHLFPSPDTTPEQALYAYKAALSRDPQLAAACRL